MRIDSIVGGPLTLQNKHNFVKSLIIFITFKDNVQSSDKNHVDSQERWASVIDDFSLCIFKYDASHDRSDNVSTC